MKTLIAAAVVGTALISPAFAQFYGPPPGFAQSYGTDGGRMNIAPRANAHAAPDRMQLNAHHSRHRDRGRYGHVGARPSWRS